MTELKRTGHVRFRDLKPISLPSSWHDLAGPRTGTLELPLRIVWAPGKRIYNVENSVDLHAAYQAILTEGTADDLDRWLNGDLLKQSWLMLHLDPRITELWEARFPELVG